MTQIHWTNPVSANFATASDWSGGVVPGASDDAILDAPGEAYTVTASANETVESIQTASNATLAVTSGTFTAAMGTGAGVNAGNMVIGNATNTPMQFIVGGDIMNTGAIELLAGAGDHGAAATQLKIKGSATLEGGGTLTLVDTDPGAGNTIGGKGPNAVFINVDNTISGVGIIGLNATLTVINEAAGVIDGTDTNPDRSLTFESATTGINAGLMEATSGGNFSISQTTLDDAGGTIQATGGGTVTTFGSTIDGGAILASGVNSRVILGEESSATGATLSTAAGGEIAIITGSTVTAGGVISNAGSIQLGSNSSDADRLTLSSATTLVGGGTVRMEGFAIEIQGVTSQVSLTNVDNTIFGNGELGAGSLKLTNEAGGVIEALGLPLTIDTGIHTIANAGLIETIDEGSAVIDSPIANTGVIEVNGGTLSVEGKVTGAGSAEITSGTLDFGSTFSQTVTFAGSTGVLELAQSANYHKTVVGFSNAGGTSLDLGDITFVSANEATYSGNAKSGVLFVTDGTNSASIRLRGNYLDAVFTASSDNNGGVSIVATMPAHPSKVARFIAAAASLPGAGGLTDATHDQMRISPLLLARPRVEMS